MPENVFEPRAGEYAAEIVDHMALRYLLSKVLNPHTYNG